MSKSRAEENRTKTVWLRLTAFGSFFATHAYGELIPWQGDRVKLERVLTPDDIERMNKRHGRGSCYQPGDMYPGFDEPEDVIKAAIERYQTAFPEAERLVLGDPIYENHRGVLHERSKG